MTWRDDGYVEALQQETIILAKRVMAARSRLLLSTCFDASPVFHDREICEVDDGEDEDLLDDFAMFSDKDIRYGATALVHNLSVISEEEMMEDEEAEAADHLKLSIWRGKQVF
nr:uncharacterized protein LOC128694903 [Cherax quadricarinatus]